MRNRENTFSLRDVIFNLLFIILFVFILLWLFPSKSFLNDNYNNNSKTTTNQVFNHNIETMKEAAISYFTTERLPQKVGDEVSLTLRQMRDKKLLLSLIDSKGNACDEGLSYVEITKEKDEYVLKVSLSCSDYEEYILVHLGCYDYCDGDVCEKKEETPIAYRYQYILSVPCKLGDFGAWSTWSTAYIAANSNRKVETQSVTATVNSTITTTCPSGYLYNTTDKKCYKTTGSADTKDAKEIINYSCETGYALDGSKCTKTTSTSTNENKITTYKMICEDSSHILSTDKTTCSYTYLDSVAPGRICTTKLVEKCTIDGCEDVGVTSCYRTCPGGYTIVGSVCQAYKSGTVASKRVVDQSYCPTGTTPSGSFCVRTSSSVDTKDAAKTTTYSCAAYGTDYLLKDKKCTKATTTTDTKDSITTVTCPATYTLDGTTCKKQVIYYRYADRACTGGYEDYQWSTTDKDITLTNKGYVLTGYKEEIKTK